MKRRTFIITTAVIGTAAGITVFLKWPKGARWEKLPLMYPVILSGFCDDEVLRNLGISYRKIVPAEDSKEKLTTILTGGIRDKQINSSDISAVASQLEVTVENDFKTGKILTLKGWIISVTEARQCALLSLS